MNGFTFVDFPSTTTPLNAENLNKATGTAIFTSGSYNLNNITDDYEAYFRGATVTNAPVSGYFWLKCLKGTNSSYVSQIVITETTPTQMYFRKKSSSWDSWRKVETEYTFSRSSTVSNTLQIIKNQWANIYNGTFLVHIKGGNYGDDEFLYGYKKDNTYGVVISLIYTSLKVQKKEYNLYNGTWSEWEQPKMQIGQEYLTNEWFLGKPVYAKIFNFGALPNKTYKNISHNLTPTAIVSLSGSSTDGKYYFPSKSYTETVELYINANYIQITTDSDWSSVSAYVTVKYTKT